MEILNAARSLFQMFTHRPLGDALASVRLDRKRFIKILLPLLIVGPIFTPQNAQCQRAYNEYEVKAAFIYNCMLFVEWPKESEKEKEEPYMICIVGDDPFGQYLDAIAESKKVKTRAIKIERIKSMEEFHSAHILFISKSEQRNQKAIQEALGEKPVLTIADFPQFVDNGGAIELLLINNRVNFRVNEITANKAKLRISAQLLSLAKEIIRDPSNESAP